MLPLMQNNGYYIPFIDPVVAPSSLISDAPLTCVTFNEEWTPIVLGALKVLARPETYLENSHSPMFCANEGQDLLARVGDCPACEELIPNWSLGIISNNQFKVSTLIPVYSPLVKVRYYAVGIFEGSPEENNTDLYIYGFDKHGNAGGKIDIYLTVYPPGRVYQLNEWDCIGGEFHDTSITTGSNLVLSYTNAKIVQVIFENTPFVFGTVKITDDAVCSNA